MPMSSSTRCPAALLEGAGTPLRSLGVTAEQAHVVVQRIRDTGAGGAFEC